jgi:hypothetical protein
VEVGGAQITRHVHPRIFSFRIFLLSSQDIHPPVRSHSKGRLFGCTEFSRLRRKSRTTPFPPFPSSCSRRSLKTYIIQSPNLNFDIDTIYAEAVLGAIGGLIGSVASAPADVLVTRIITQVSSTLAARTGMGDARAHLGGEVKRKRRGALQSAHAWDPSDWSLRRLRVC